MGNNSSTESESERSKRKAREEEERAKEASNTVNVYAWKMLAAYWKGRKMKVSLDDLVKATIPKDYFEVLTLWELADEKKLKERFPGAPVTILFVSHKWFGKKCDNEAGELKKFIEQEVTKLEDKAQKEGRRSRIFVLLDHISLDHSIVSPFLRLVPSIAMNPLVKVTVFNKQEDLYKKSVFCQLELFTFVMGRMLVLSGKLIGSRADDVMNVEEAIKEIDEEFIEFAITQPKSELKCEERDLQNLKESVTWLKEFGNDTLSILKLAIERKDVNEKAYLENLCARLLTIHTAFTGAKFTAYD